MVYGVAGMGLPEENIELVRRLSLRWLRAAGPHNVWAKKAKTCIDFLEGRQYTDEELAIMREVRRTAITINKMAPLFRLVLGYQSSNRMDISYLPTSDSQSSEKVAEILTMLTKVEGNREDLKFKDTEVFADGLATGRGFWDMRLCFDNNDLGEVKVDVCDPFSVFIDPDANTYDLNDSAAYIQGSVWTDIDHIGATYGQAAAEAVENMASPHYSSHLLHFLGEQDISPDRYFGMYRDDKAMGNWADVYHTDFVDAQAKRIRLLDSQYVVKKMHPCFLDLETGDKQPIPEEWLKRENHYKIQAALDHAEKLNNPLKVVQRPVKRIRWTVSCADVLLYDAWSPFDTYTKIGFFPYFRRGMTRGMLDDLIDPSREINKKRSVMMDILSRNANSGWMYEENSLDPEQEANLRQYGSSPGINVKWKRGPNGGESPKRIEPGNYPQGLDRLEEKAAADLFQISGINESALGQLDKVQSGRAIEARQRQAVLSIQMYTDNFARSKKTQGRKWLELFQKHYTEERMYRAAGDDSTLVQYEINKKIETGVNGFTRLNDITVGKYIVEVDETPISATFKQAQFEETMLLLEKLGPVGQLLIETSPDLIIDQTSLPRKEDWKRGLMQASAMTPPGMEQVGAGAALLPPEMPLPSEAATNEDAPKIIRFDAQGNRV